jgi:putative transposase
MPRQPRLVISGYPHHVILRGNNKSAIFYSDEDRRFFIACLKEAKEKTRSEIYAYCFMMNHIHLLVAPSIEGGLSGMMQSLGRRYVQYINKKYTRTGTLWEGRFKSSLVGEDQYFLACSTYIELNPVRAKLVQHPGDYRWSSYGFKAEGRRDDILNLDSLYQNLGKTPESRQLAYKAIFEQLIDKRAFDMIRHVTQKGGVFGDTSFIEKINKLIGRKIVLRTKGRPKKSL